MMKIKLLITILSLAFFLYGTVNLVLLNLHNDEYIIQEATLCQGMYNMESDQYQACVYNILAKLSREENYGRLFAMIGLALPTIFVFIPHVFNLITKKK